MHKQSSKHSCPEVPGPLRKVTARNSDRNREKGIPRIQEGNGDDLGDVETKTDEGSTGNPNPREF